MRKIIASEFMSLDGVSGPANQLTAQYFSEEPGQVLRPYAGSGALLLGGCYQEFVPTGRWRPDELCRQDESAQGKARTLGKGQS